jgi:DNA-binding response OmpR family regulator
MTLVLVVEDNRMLRTLYVAGLSGYGFQVAEAETLEDARQRLQTKPLPDTVLLDLQLPDGSGRELIQFVREELSWADLPIIVATGLRGEEDDLMAAGANAVLSKPIEFAVLFARLQALLEKPRS